MPKNNTFRLKFWIVLVVIVSATEVFLFMIGIKMGISPVTFIIVSFAAIMSGYFCWWDFMSVKRNKILDEKCDPLGFIEEYEKIKVLSKRIFFQNFCNINIAVGLISLGRNSEALDILLKKVRLRAKDGKIFEATYRLALFCCYININDLDKATFEYENHLKELRKSINHPGLFFAVDISVAEYQYKLNRTEETAKACLEQLNYLYTIYSKKINKRGKLSILYNKADILQALGDDKGAAEKYKIVAQNGNNLWIAQMSETKLKEIEALNGR